MIASLYHSGSDALAGFFTRYFSAFVGFASLAAHLAKANVVAATTQAECS
jgi:hypothetical protein